MLNENHLDLWLLLDVGVVEEEELRLLLNERHNEVILDNRKASLGLLPSALIKSSQRVKS